MDIFSVAERHMSWLGARQAQASVNVANVDTPGFKAREISAFTKELKTLATRLERTDPAHMQGSRNIQLDFESEKQDNAEVSLSGNDVVIEKEMRTIGENARLFAFDVGLLKSFHRMLIASVKG